MSSESIVSPATPAGATESCASCGAPLANDQRYCLECGERRAPMSSVLLGGPPLASSAEPAGSSSTGPVTAPPVSPPDSPGSPSAGDSGRGNAVTVIAGVGVLLLAMGVGVLIGRSGGGSKQVAATPQVINVATSPASPTGSGGSSEGGSFTDDWPSGANGYTVQLQTLRQSGTQVSAVEAAKTAATGKGAKQVGALKSEDFSSLTPGSYIVYSGVYHKKPEAVKALAGLKKSFPGAKVITVSNRGNSAATGSSGSGVGSGGSGVGASESHPAPPKVVEELHNTKGKSYEEKSKNLPNVISTG